MATIEANVSMNLEDDDAEHSTKLNTQFRLLNVTSPITASTTPITLKQSSFTWPSSRSGDGKCARCSTQLNQVYMTVIVDGGDRFCQPCSDSISRIGVVRFQLAEQHWRNRDELWYTTTLTPADRKREVPSIQSVLDEHGLLGKTVVVSDVKTHKDVSTKRPITDFVNCRLLVWLHSYIPPQFRVDQPLSNEIMSLFAKEIAHSEKKKSGYRFCRLRIPDVLVISPTSTTTTTTTTSNTTTATTTTSTKAQVRTSISFHTHSDWEHIFINQGLKIATITMLSSDVQYSSSLQDTKDTKDMMTRHTTATVMVRAVHGRLKFCDAQIEEAPRD